MTKKTASQFMLPLWIALALTAVGGPAQAVCAPSDLGRSWYGVRQVTVSDLPYMRSAVGGSVTTLSVNEEMSLDEVITRLEQIASLDYVAVVNLKDASNCSGRPWEWNGSEWVFPNRAVAILQGTADHPAVLAIYALHEPFNQNAECHWTVEEQQLLYQELHGYTGGLPVWSDIGGVAPLEEGGISWAGGICDYCGTFHHSFRSDWSSEQCLQETLAWIDADLDAQGRLMPQAQVVFQAQTFSQPGYPYYPLRLPTAQELAVVRDHLCQLHEPVMYYPWSHGLYEETLRDAPDLWPVVAAGCGRTSYLPLIRTE
ncbi:MAG: hypothetical protein JW900_12680 [Anaerolineae bacterium]|nr:hypothetical protein [Anaerolineae bacterium]